jgi:hypothetical protein
MCRGAVGINFESHASLETVLFTRDKYLALTHFINAVIEAAERRVHYKASGRNVVEGGVHVIINKL